MDGGGSKQAITMQVEIDALKQVLEVENAVTAPLENFDLVVKAFHKAAILSMNEIVGDFFPPMPKQIQEVIKTMQADCSEPVGSSRGVWLGLVSWIGSCQRWRLIVLENHRLALQTRNAQRNLSRFFALPCSLDF